LHLPHDSRCWSIAIMLARSSSWSI